MAGKSRQAEGSGEEREEKDVLRVGLGEALRELRKESGLKLSQGELSTRAGLPWNAIGDLERGERTIKGDELKSICRVLGIPLQVFMARVTRAQLKALGEPAPSAEPEGAEGAGALDLYVTMALGGRTPEQAVRILHRIINARRPTNPEEEG